MAVQIRRLLLPDELEDAEKTSDLAATDRDALRAVSAWINEFVSQPHKDLGRAGAVCPFVPGSLERRTLWLAAEHVTDRGVSQVVELMDGYKRLLLQVAPADSDDAIYRTIIVVFPDLSAEHAGALFNDVLEQLAELSYEEDGIIFGPFYDGNEGTASTTRTSDRSSRRFRSSSCATQCSATGSSSLRTTPCSTDGLVTSDRPGPPPSAKSSAARPGAPRTTRRENSAFRPPTRTREAPRSRGAFVVAGGPTSSDDNSVAFTSAASRRGRH